MKPRGYLINGNFYDENVSDSELDLVTPLYLEEPQLKPLSDEEIDECKSKAMEQFYQLVTPQAIDQQMLIIDRLFARTIEERHGIK